jgi:hypothetical protein
VLELRKVGEYWDLLIDGEVNIRQESFAVADGVKSALEGQVVAGELVEVADVIRVRRRA